MSEKKQARKKVPPKSLKNNKEIKKKEDAQKKSVISENVINIIFIVIYSNFIFIQHNLAKRKFDQKEETGPTDCSHCHQSDVKVPDILKILQPGFSNSYSCACKSTAYHLSCLPMHLVWGDSLESKELLPNKLKQISFHCSSKKI